MLQRQQPRPPLIIRSAQKMKPLPHIQKCLFRPIVTRHEVLVHDVLPPGPFQFVWVEVPLGLQAVALSENVEDYFGASVGHFEEEGDVRFGDAVVGAAEEVEEDVGGVVDGGA